MEHLPSDMLSAIAELVVVIQAMIAQQLSRSGGERDDQRKDAARSHELHDGRAAPFDSALESWPQNGPADAQWPQPRLDRSRL